MDRQDKLMKILGGMVRLLIADLAGAMILMVYMFVYGKGVIVSFLVGLCTTGVVCGLVADYVLKFSSKVRDNVKYKKKPDSRNFGVVMGLFLMIPGLAASTVALVAYLDIIPRNWCALFHLFNTYFVPIVDIPIHGHIGNPFKYNIWAIVLMYFMQIFIFLTCAVTYRLGYENIDVAEKVMYKGRDNGV